MWQAERALGSVVLSWMAPSRGQSRGWRGPAGTLFGAAPGARVFSFIGGMQALPDALVAKLGRDNVRQGCPVEQLELLTMPGPGPPKWRVSYRDRAMGGVKRKEEDFDAVVHTASWYSLSESMQLVSQGRPVAAEALPSAIYAPVSVLVLGFPREQCGTKPKGSHVVIPHASSFGSHCVAFNSDAFRGRAPEGYELFTLFFGGSREPAAAELPRADLLAHALKDLGQLAGVDGSPIFTRHVYWKRAIPLYSAGYETELQKLHQLRASMPGLHFAGNHLGGVEVGALVDASLALAGQVGAGIKDAKAAAAAAQRAEERKQRKEELAAERKRQKEALRAQREAERRLRAADREQKDVGRTDRAQGPKPEEPPPAASPELGVEVDSAEREAPEEEARRRLAEEKAKEWGMEEEVVIEKLRKQQGTLTLDAAESPLGTEAAEGELPPPKPAGAPGGRAAEGLLKSFLKKVQQEPQAAPEPSEEERRQQRLKDKKLIEEDVALQLIAEREYAKLERARVRAEIRAEQERARRRGDVQ
mmetsp:Transcript_18664/g.52511  ORF Transcript_18664/g.52511 Transcript_18664/m.52511 type:complete len:532 (-) Transcript_18664:67-1662(-)